MAAAPGWTRRGRGGGAGQARGLRRLTGTGTDGPVDGNAHSLPVRARSLPAGKTARVLAYFRFRRRAKQAGSAAGLLLPPPEIRGHGARPRRLEHPGHGAGARARKARGTARFLGKKRDCLFSGIFGGSGAGDGHGGEKLSLQDIAELIQTKACQRVVVMVGAGISTPSGIPDFRSPGSGLYSNLEQYDLPYPEAIFELDFFFHNPKPFFALAKELYPGNYRPNLAHYFLRLLHDKGLLLRLYTQNIDGLERAAGIPATKLVEAHGTFASATCTICRQSFSGEEFRVDVMADRIPRCPICMGVIKPDIIFFGEQLPQRFFLHMADFPMADLLIIIGTSLEVEPFASLSEASRRSVPRVLINRELVGPFAWRPRHNDVAQLGDIIGGVERLVKALGWTKEIQDLMQRETSQDAL
ncbi:NAD-dependent protein deacetylase sirtuin-3, mitochondrial isoform X2 [Sarcophilus harrisii]|uniref:NAD-dependent protein deacetylase sirtuin-3, mitochondrial isoform X2 n=1 Tax=Sarcophilus harrisii TaxID=9305 RepID=UPI001301F0F6|nr:NAD-dependent protein deacetylase sirtuin-3, mitochondrial isoform X2 [Sarcophilus harrisii]